MQDRPDLNELLASVREFLEAEVVPAAADARLRFRARIAANLLAVAAREIRLADSQCREESRRLAELLGRPEPEGKSERGEEPRAAAARLNEELASRIRSGDMAAEPGSAVWEHLRRTAVEKLEIANPPYLERRRA